MTRLILTQNILKHMPFISPDTFDSKPTQKIIDLSFLIYLCQYFRCKYFDANARLSSCGTRIPHICNYKKPIIVNFSHSLIQKKKTRPDLFEATLFQLQ